MFWILSLDCINIKITSVVVSLTNLETKIVFRGGVARRILGSLGSIIKLVVDGYLTVIGTEVSGIEIMVDIGEIVCCCLIRGANVWTWYEFKVFGGFESTVSVISIEGLNFRFCKIFFLLGDENWDKLPKQENFENNSLYFKSFRIHYVNSGINYKNQLYLAHVTAKFHQDIFKTGNVFCLNPNLGRTYVKWGLCEILNRFGWNSAYALSFIENLYF